MSWLRLDDGFATNPKIAALSDRELRVWLRVLCYCAQLQDPTVDRVTIREVSGLTLRVISKLIDVGLLDESGSDYEVHDWAFYQPKDKTGADRQAKWRARHPDKRNGLRNAASNGSDRYENVTSRVGARARPVPYPSSETPSVLPSTPTPNPDGRTEGESAWPTEAELADLDRDELGVPLNRHEHEPTELDVNAILKDIPA
jgi:hypothetical protein